MWVRTYESLVIQRTGPTEASNKLVSNAVRVVSPAITLIAVDGVLSDDVSTR